MREAAGASLLGRFMLLSSAIVIVLVIRVQSILIELGTMAAAVAWDVRAGARSRGDRRGHEAVGGEAPDVEAAATGTGGP